MDSEPEKRMELRRMLVDNYSVYNTIRDERVIVTDVLYTASDIEARVYLKFRLRINDIILKEYWWLCGKKRDTWNWWD